MAVGEAAVVLSYDHAHGLHQVDWDLLPDWVSTAFREASDQDDWDRTMAEAGAMCIEAYGISVESMEVWRLPNREGWLILHADGDDLDFVTFIHDPALYYAYQCQLASPMAQKIMAEDKYWIFKQELDRRYEQENNQLH